MTDQDTIFALSSGQVPAAIAIIRICGPKAMDAARALTDQPLPAPRKAGLRRLYHPSNREPLDEALLICFPGPHTETGEDQVEFHCHGSRAVVSVIEVALAELPGLRRAGPGEFTRRAFLNGKIDLAGIEGLGDLVAAETELQRRAAMAMFGGALSRKIADWTKSLRQAAAQIEAQLDFADEDDVASGQGMTVVVAQVCGVAQAIAGELAKPTSLRLKDGIRVAIAGPPNAGKSSLFNALIGRDAAIVSPHAGTTRDVIDAAIAFNGVPFLLSDSAGLHVTDEEIEQIGIDRAEALIAHADIILWLGEREAIPQTDGVIFHVSAKSDLIPAWEEGADLSLSSKTGDGVDALIDAICSAANSLLPKSGDYALSERQHDTLNRAVSALNMTEDLQDEILVGECLRQALSALDELTGLATTEAMLDELFNGFCIGK